MKKLRRAPRTFQSYSTCYRNGRLFHFSQDYQQLQISEALLGDNVEIVELETRAACSSADNERIGCCSLDCGILVVSGSWTESSAFLVSIDDGPLTAKTVHIKRLELREQRGLRQWPFFSHISGNMAMTYFGTDNSIWSYAVSGTDLVITEIGTRAPGIWGLGAPALRLSEDKFIVAGSAGLSMDITLISRGAEIKFEKIGCIPGPPRRGPSSILVKERFVLGFGGSAADDLWIFDVQTKKSSIIWEKGSWPCQKKLQRLSEFSTLVLNGDTLYVFGRYVHAITLQEIASLIDDDKIRRVFASACGLSKVSKYVLPPIERTEFEMQKLEGCIRANSSSMVSHRGRLFFFTAGGTKFTISEIVFFGRRAKDITVPLKMRFCDGPIGCCSLGNHILVMTGQKKRISAALVTVEKGRLRPLSVSTKRLTVNGDKVWPGIPFVRAISDTTALLFFDGQSATWLCEVSGTTLSVTKQATQMPTEGGFRCLPIGLPDGALLAAGDSSGFTDITRISVNGRPRCEFVGVIPGVGRYGASLVLIRDRFVVGFGGTSIRGHETLDDLWIFDLQTRHGSQLSKRGMWHPKANHVFMVVQGGTLYLIGGTLTTSVYCIALEAFGGLVRDWRLKADFCSCMGFSIASKRPWKGRLVYENLVPCL